MLRFYYKVQYSSITLQKTCEHLAVVKPNPSPDFSCAFLGIQLDFPQCRGTPKDWHWREHVCWTFCLCGQLCQGVDGVGRTQGRLRTWAQTTSSMDKRLLPVTCSLTWPSASSLVCSEPSLTIPATTTTSSLLEALQPKAAVTLPNSKSKRKEQTGVPRPTWLSGHLLKLVPPLSCISTFPETLSQQRSKLFFKPLLFTASYTKLY